MTLHDQGFLGPIGAEAHGSRKCFAAGCRCLPCRSAESCYQGMRARARAHGQTAWIDAGPSRRHIAALVDQGLGVRQIAALARVSPRTVQAIKLGRPRVTPAIEARILQVRPLLAGGAYVNGYKTFDKIRLLLKEGYSETQLRAWLGIGQASLRRRAKRVRVSMAVRVLQVYRHLTAE